MWAVVTWRNKDRSDARIQKNDDGTPMIFGSHKEADDHAVATLFLIDHFRSVLLAEEK